MSFFARVSSPGNPEQCCPAIGLGFSLFLKKSKPLLGVFVRLRCRRREAGKKEPVRATQGVRGPDV